jgi:hypothetical protein
LGNAFKFIGNCNAHAAVPHVTAILQHKTEYCSVCHDKDYQRTLWLSSWLQSLFRVASESELPAKRTWQVRRQGQLLCAPIVLARKKRRKKKEREKTTGRRLAGDRERRGTNLERFEGSDCLLPSWDDPSGEACIRISVGKRKFNATWSNRLILALPHVPTFCVEHSLTCAVLHSPVLCSREGKRSGPSFATVAGGYVEL